MKLIVRYFLDCGRMGEVEGLFVTNKESLEKTYGREVCFGEILGKHSDVYAELDADSYVIVTEDQDFINRFVEIMGDGTISGYSPLDYLEDEEPEDE